jgi:hypothetical protein
VVSHIAQVFAFLLAAIWTYKAFWESERPGLKAKPAVTSDLNWNFFPDNPDLCNASFRVEFKNGGKQSLNIETVVYEAWLADVKKPTGDATVSINPESLMRTGESIWTKTLEQSMDPKAKPMPLLGHFPPGYTEHDTQDFLLTKTKDKFIVFQQQAEATSGGDFAGEAGSEGYRGGKLLSPERRRAAVEHAGQQYGIGERHLCRLVGQWRSNPASLRNFHQRW